MVKRITAHKVEKDHGLVFRVIWKGFPDKGDDDPDSWISWRTNFNNEKVVTYMNANPELKGLVKELSIQKTKMQTRPRHK